ncbi:ABC-three component system protein [Microvirga sp. TS319]|uniref:ABC-three component system protein n=1 Tax=Microvirga sp. TS319 TaxID=3241165 RepID=UPI00351A6D58
MTPLPHAPCATACEAFLAINDDLQLDILKNARIMPGQSNIRQIEDELAKMLTGVRTKDRAHVAARMVEWWNREIVHAHCGKRPKASHRHELVDLQMNIVAEVTTDAFVDCYAREIPPPAYQSHPMVARQIELVGGSEAAIDRYDVRLKEEWSDRHVDMCAQCRGQPDEHMALKGKELLSWSHFSAPNEIESIAPTVTAPSYVRGSFQVLSIDGQVGWHPDYRKLLSFDK